MKTTLKYMLAGAAGLLMLSLNLAGLFSRDDASAASGYSAEQPTDNKTVNLTGCSHDCAACGKCFSNQETAGLEAARKADNLLPYSLSVE